MKDKRKLDVDAIMKALLIIAIFGVLVFMGGLPIILLCGVIETAWDFIIALPLIVVIISLTGCAACYVIREIKEGE